MTVDVDENASAGDDLVVKDATLRGFHREAFWVDAAGNRVVERIAEWGDPPPHRFVGVKRIEIVLPDGVVTPDGLGSVFRAIEFPILAESPLAAFMLYAAAESKAIDAERARVSADLERWRAEAEVLRGVDALRAKIVAAGRGRHPHAPHVGKKLPPSLDAKRSPHRPDGA